MVKERMRDAIGGVTEEEYQARLAAASTPVNPALERSMSAGTVRPALLGVDHRPQRDQEQDVDPKPNTAANCGLDEDEDVREQDRDSSPRSNQR